MLLSCYVGIVCISLDVNTVSKICHYIFEYNLNCNCPITIIFDTLIRPTQTIGHRKMVSFFSPHLFSAVSLTMRNFRTLKVVNLATIADSLNII